MKKVNVINRDQIQKIIFEETNKVMQELSGSGFPSKPRAPRRGFLENVDYTFGALAAVVSGWEAQEGDIQFLYDGGTQTSGGVYYFDPGDTITLELKNVVIRPRKGSYSPSKRFSRHGHGTWSKRFLKKRNYSPRSAKRVGTDLVVYSRTEKWDGAEKFRGGNKAWKRSTVSIRLQINYSKWVQKRVEAQRKQKIDDIFKDFKPTPQDTEMGRQVSDARLQDPVCVVRLDKSKTKNYGVILHMEWMERMEADGSFESDEDVARTDPESLSKQTRNMVRDIDPFQGEPPK